MALIISEPQTKKLVDMPTALKLVDGMFRARAAGKVRSVPRRRLKGSEKQLNMMAAWQADWDWICLRAYAGASNTVTLTTDARARFKPLSTWDNSVAHAPGGLPVSARNISPRLRLRH